MLIKFFFYVCTLLARGYDAITRAYSVIYAVWMGGTGGLG